ncbi:MAG: pantoate--beta-alanine ligase [Campylobacterota bacterium]|nr:pantoate--beta-alanine ligase [Campylobacterota bacterium]
MKIINSIDKLRDELKKNNKSIGFVPTMGALHDGHISLIKQSRVQNEIVVVSIFVNPTQFLEGEDFDSYPNKKEADIKICELCKVDYLFMPEISTLYDTDEVLIKAPKISGFIFEGEKRAGHFDGMLQVVLKLLNIVKPKNAYFGKKDAQQLSLISQMVKNLYIDVNIVACDIVRENDGLAYSSRNVYLSKTQREESLLISKSLKKAAKNIGMGEYSSKILIEQMNNILTQSNLVDVEYISIVNRQFRKLESVELQNTIILVAVKIGKTRLIDNIWI